LVSAADKGDEPWDGATDARAHFTKCVQADEVEAANAKASS
jgi:hypothetical protein